MTIDTGTKISQLPVLTTPGLGDYVPILDDTVTKAITVGGLLSVAGAGTLSGAHSSGAVTLTLTGVPAWVVANACWVVIDAPTSECEVRKVTAVSGNQITVAATGYNHADNDPVFFIWQPVVNVKWMGAKGDDSTDDYTAISRALVQANSLGSGACYAPEGTYLISAGLVLGNGVSLIGDGQTATILKATTNGITMITADTGDSPVPGYYYLKVKNMRLDGDNKATIGLYTGKAVMSHFSDLHIRYCTYGVGYGVVMDRSQNQQWDNVLVSYCDTNYYLANASSNNQFNNCHGDSPNTANLHIKVDTGLPGYNGALNNDPNQNAFVRCLFERLTPTDSVVHIEDGHRNTFYCCDFVRDVTATTPLLKVDADSNLNHFYDCRFNGGSAPGVVVATVAGNDTVFEHCHWTDLSGATDLVQVSNGWIRWTGEVPADGSINVTSGDIHARVKSFELERMAGATTDRPTGFGEVVGCVFYDTDLNKPIWYDATSATDWRDATGAAV